jgi:hypothetical protein
MGQANRTTAPTNAPETQASQRFTRRDNLNGRGSVIAAKTTTAGPYLLSK